MIINERLKALRDLMRERHIDIYMIPTADFHESEYVGSYFKCRSFMSGFTGSAGVLTVTLSEAGLWTDGRYFIQAARELKDSEIKLFKMGEENVPTVSEYIESTIKKGEVLGFDGRVVSGSLGESLLEKLEKKGASIKYDEDLVDLIWSDRPKLSKEKAYFLDIKYSGMSLADKLSRVREKMTENSCDAHILTSLDDIAWLYNMRGNDIECNPVVLSYTVIMMNEAYLFLNEEVLSAQMKQEFEKNKVYIRPYNDIYSFVSELEFKSVMLEKSRVNYSIIKLLKAEIVDKMNPTTEFKAVKNETELNNTRLAHIKDGVAFTKFMYWLKNNIGRIDMTEVSAQEYLREMRASQDNFIELSFDTICAYKGNAAMMHYSADENRCAELRPEGLLLVDSGGQYFEGTTDITRTMALGAVKEEQKVHFTAVARGMLNLLNAKFLYGCRGINLDILARGPVWELDIDYKCGTGHGVGHVLNVHEGPNGIRCKLLDNNASNCVLEEGMITTNEPGVYIEGSHGIRIENEMICREGVKNEHGRFMYFENITFAPIDLDAIKPELMSVKERELLNSYHEEVYEKISPYMTEEEKNWLRHYTRSI